MLIYNPLQIVLVTCRGKSVAMGRVREHHDILATSWQCPASDSPPLYSVFLSNKHDLSLIRSSKVFCVNFMAYEHRAQAAFCARHIGDHIDKFQETELTLKECEKIDCPRIGEAVGYIECEVIEEHITGDHVLFVGKVLNSDVRDANAKRLMQE